MAPLVFAAGVGAAALLALLWAALSKLAWRIAKAKMGRELASAKARWELEHQEASQGTLVESFTLGWLNLVVRSLWTPILEKHLAGLTMELLQRVLNEVLEKNGAKAPWKYVQGITIEEFGFGMVPPQFQHCCARYDPARQLLSFALDAEFTSSGAQGVLLLRMASIGGLLQGLNVRAEATHIRIRGRLHIGLQLTHEPPGIKGVYYSFAGEPELDIAARPLGASRFSSELPGIVGALRGLLLRVIRRRLVEPNRRFFDAQRMYVNRHVKRAGGPGGLLRFVVLCARNIAPAPPPSPPAAAAAGAAPAAAAAAAGAATAGAAAARDAPAAYCKLRYGRQALRTPLVRHSGSPVWNWEFALALPAAPAELAARDECVHLVLLDARAVGDPAPLGKCQLSLAGLGLEPNGPPLPALLPVSGGAPGAALQLSLQWQLQAQGREASQPSRAGSVGAAVPAAAAAAAPPPSPSGRKLSLSAGGGTGGGRGPPIGVPRAASASLIANVHARPDGSPTRMRKASLPPQAPPGAAGWPAPEAQQQGAPADAEGAQPARHHVRGSIVNAWRAFRAGRHSSMADSSGGSDDAAAPAAAPAASDGSPGRLVARVDSDGRLHIDGPGDGAPFSGGEAGTGEAGPEQGQVQLGSGAGGGGPAPAAAGGRGDGGDAASLSGLSQDDSSAWSVPLGQLTATGQQQQQQQRGEEEQQGAGGSVAEKESPAPFIEPPAADGARAQQPCPPPSPPPGLQLQLPPLSPQQLPQSARGGSPGGSPCSRSSAGAGAGGGGGAAPTTPLVLLSRVAHLQRQLDEQRRGAEQLQAQLQAATDRCEKLRRLRRAEGRLALLEGGRFLLHGRDGAARPVLLWLDEPGACLCIAGAPEGRGLQWLRAGLGRSRSHAHIAGAAAAAAGAAGAAPAGGGGGGGEALAAAWGALCCCERDELALLRQLPLAEVRGVRGGADLFFARPAAGDDGSCCLTIVCAGAPGGGGGTGGGGGGSGYNLMCWVVNMIVTSIYYVLSFVTSTNLVKSYKLLDISISNQIWRAPVAASVLGGLLVLLFNLLSCAVLIRKSVEKRGPGFGYGFVVAMCFTLAFFVLLCGLVLDGFRETVVTELQAKLAGTWGKYSTGAYNGTIAFSYLCFIMFMLFCFALIVFQTAVSEELGISAVRPAAAANPYAQMAELPYPSAYGAHDHMGAVPPGFKVPLAGVPQAPGVHMMGGAAPPQQPFAVPQHMQLNPDSLVRLSYIPEPDDTALYAQQLASPNHVRQISVLQLDNLVRQHSLPRLVASAAFLSSQLPARLENHISRLEALLPSCASPGLKALITGSAESKAGVLEVSRDWRLLDTSDLAGLQHFESHLGGFRELVEGEIARLMGGAQELAQGRGWWAREGDVHALNAALDITHWYVLGLRLMLNQHSAALHALSSSDGGGGGGGGHSAPPRPPPGGAPPLVGGGAAGPPASMVERAMPLRALLQGLSEDVRALCVEKNSAAPDVEVVGGEGLEVPLVVPYFSFLISEAVVDRHGAWNVDEADPVRIEISEPEGDARHVLVKITDRGLGVPAKNFTHMFDWFWTSSRKPLLGYGYSRAHGAQMHGLGAGVPVSRVLAHFMGGSAHWETSPHELHTTVEIRVPRHGFVF
ncbi:MAG: hypothetical protein J3K34DRAFT_516008 [Monoraphidium minutum]|nr:MAG: hypothetical protein J3K34DRAFT_516008 [Monoraphidium minutum]